jgi:hypothetical protein
MTLSLDVVNDGDGSVTEFWVRAIYEHRRVRVVEARDSAPRSGEDLFSEWIHVRLKVPEDSLSKLRHKWGA